MIIDSRETTLDMGGGVRFWLNLTYTQSTLLIFTLALVEISIQKI